MTGNINAPSLYKLTDAHIEADGQFKVFVCQCGKRTRRRTTDNRINCTGCNSHWKDGKFHHYIDLMNEHGSYMKRESPEPYRTYRIEGKNTVRYEREPDMEYA